MRSGVIYIIPAQSPERESAAASVNPKERTT